MRNGEISEIERKKVGNCKGNQRVGMVDSNAEKNTIEWCLWKWLDSQIKGWLNRKRGFHIIGAIERERPQYRVRISSCKRSVKRDKG